MSSLALQPDNSLHLYRCIVDRLQVIDFSHTCYPSYRVQILPLVGFVPTEHSRLIWTHHPIEENLLKLKFEVGRHAFILYGYDETKECFYIKNSWGDGNSALPYDYVENCTSKAWIGYGEKIITVFSPEAKLRELEDTVYKNTLILQNLKGKVIEKHEEEKNLKKEIAYLDRQDIVLYKEISPVKQENGNYLYEYDDRPFFSARIWRKSLEETIKGENLDGGWFYLHEKKINTWEGFCRVEIKRKYAVFCLFKEAPCSLKIYTERRYKYVDAIMQLCNEIRTKSYEIRKITMDGMDLFKENEIMIKEKTEIEELNLRWLAGDKSVLESLE